VYVGMANNAETYEQAEFARSRCALIDTLFEPCDTASPLEKALLTGQATDSAFSSNGGPRKSRLGRAVMMSTEFARALLRLVGDWRIPSSCGPDGSRSAPQEIAPKERVLAREELYKTTVYPLPSSEPPCNCS
jgi:hypothetical protein